MERIERTWYASEGSRWAEFLTILHQPYTGMVLCYVVLGALMVPEIHPDRLLWMLVAYVLGLGIGAHALDQLSGRPYGRSFTVRELWVLAIVTLSAAIAIGAYYAITLAPWLWAFIVVETFFAVAYNLDRLFAGRFHADGWFVFSWGALPFLTSFYLQSLTLTLSALAMAGALAGTAGMEISLSRWVRALRKDPTRLLVTHTDGRQEEWDLWRLIGRPERALKLLVVTVYLFTVSLALQRLFSM